MRGWIISAFGFDGSMIYETFEKKEEAVNFLKNDLDYDVIKFVQLYRLKSAPIYPGVPT